MKRRTRERLQGVVALTVIMTITFGVPAILVRVAGWPMPRSMPDWSRVRVALMQGDIPAETVVKALAVVVWLIWLQVVWALAWECVVNVPRVTAGRRPKSAPLVANPVGNGVGRLVALVMSIGLTIASMPATAIALPSAPIDGSPAANPTSTLAMASTQGQPVEQSIAAPRWKVDKQDSLWRIAEIALGEGDRSNEILELNSWLRSPRDVRAGHVLVLPFDAGVPEDRQPPVDPDPSASPNDGTGVVSYLAPSHIVIEPGDNLWDLSEDRLSIVDPDVTPRETLDQVNAVIALNPEVVEDPNLIYPGEVFEFPAVGTPPAPEAPVVDTGDPAVDVVEDPDASPPGPPATVDEQPAEASPVPTTAPAPRAAPVPATSVVQEAGSDPAVSHDVPGSRSLAPWVAGISGATVLASGLLLMYRRRLALRAARGARAYRASKPDDCTVLSAITRAADVGLLRWANHELAELFAAMRPGDVAGMPLAIELSETHGIEMLWTQANLNAPRPWEAMDGGWSWRLLYDENLPLPEIEPSAAVPALATFGTRDGNQLLLNLEAFGALAIDATEQTAEAFARSIIVELAAGDLLSDAYLACAGAALDGAFHFDRIQCCNEVDANERLESAVTASTRFLEAGGLASMFEARLGGDAAGREATVVTIPAAGADATVIRSLRPGLGACALIVGHFDSASAVVTIDDKGVGHLEPIGLRFEPALLPIATMEAVEDLLDEASEPFEDRGDSSPTAHSRDTVPNPNEPEEPSLELGDADFWELHEPKVLVRVLGVPEVIGDGHLGRIETSIVAYLSCHGGKRTDDQIINAVWNGRLVESKTLWNKISKIRSALGPELVPARLPSSVSVNLADAVVSDLCQLRAVFERSADVSSSEAVAILLRGLELVNGVPFDSPDYEWAYESQHHAEACELIESAALRCSETALSLGDVASARVAVAHGLRALPLNEPLYRERMRIESAAGNPDGVRRSLTELRTALRARSDGTVDLEPEHLTLKVAASLAPSGGVPVTVPAEFV